VDADFVPVLSAPLENSGETRVADCVDIRVLHSRRAGPCARLVSPFGRMSELRDSSARGGSGRQGRWPVTRRAW